MKDLSEPRGSNTAGRHITNYDEGRRRLALVIETVILFS